MKLLKRLFIILILLCLNITYVKAVDLNLTENISSNLSHQSTYDDDELNTSTSRNYTSTTSSNSGSSATVSTSGISSSTMNLSNILNIFLIVIGILLILLAIAILIKLNN